MGLVFTLGDMFSALQHQHCRCVGGGGKGGGDGVVLDARAG